MKYEINLETIFSSVEGFTRISTNTEHTPSRCLIGKKCSITNRFYLLLITYRTIFTAYTPILSNNATSVSACQPFLSNNGTSVSACQPFLSTNGTSVSACQPFLSTNGTSVSACQPFLSGLYCCLNQFKLSCIPNFFILNINNH